MLECPLGQCDGSSWILDEDTNASRPCECRARRVQRAQVRHVASAIPRRYRGMSFDRQPVADIDPAVLRPVRRFVQSLDDSLQQGRGLWLVGPTGTGKTSLAMLICRIALESGAGVGIYTVPRLLAEIRDTFEAGSERSYSDFVRGLFEVDLLLLDDLGAERVSEWVLEQLYVIINERWMAERSLIVTSNVEDPDQLGQQLGARTVSRLRGICGDPVAVHGHDVRLRVVDGE